MQYVFLNYYFDLMCIVISHATPVSCQKRVKNAVEKIQGLWFPILSFVLAGMQMPVRTCVGAYIYVCVRA